MMLQRASHCVRLLHSLTAVLATAVGLYAADRCEGEYALRAGGGPPEWSDSAPEAAERLTCSLEGVFGEGPATLLLQYDGVKRSDWRATLNGQSLGLLLPDEHKQTQAFEVPADLLQTTENELRLEADGGRNAFTDDIRIGKIRLIADTIDAWLSAGHVQVRVVDERGEAIPARITVTDGRDALMPVGAQSGEHLAVRPGVIYSGSGEAEFTLPVGDHTIYASRGFEYSVASEELSVAEGSSQAVELTLQHEVVIPGWTSGDTHLHTRERSGHGDATAAERAITVVGEGLDWGVSTEHNKPLTLPDLGGRFLAIRGVELTTQHGHFNIFPWPDAVPLVDPSAQWDELWEGLPNDVASIWNHPRDIHAEYRPIDGSHYVELAGEAMDSRPFRGSAMEVVNSSAMYSHPLELVRDWMRRLNRGDQVSAVGSSDTHTVSIVHVGQARTYAHTGEGAPTATSVADAFARGETAVSFGLVAFLDRTDTGLHARVYGPSWNPAKRLIVFANGEVIADFPIEASATGGLQWEGEIRPPTLAQDARLAVVAVGNGPYLPYWPLNRPYQAVSPEWTPMTLGVSPAIEWDGNGDGRFESAREIAIALVERTTDAAEVARALTRHDLAVAAQAGLLLIEGGRLADVEAALPENAPGAVRERLRLVARQYAAAAAGPL